MGCLTKVVMTLMLLATACQSTVAADQNQNELLFVRRIAPLLAAKCVACHGSDRREGGLDLRTRQSLTAGGDSGLPLILPGAVEQSPLLLAVQRQSADWSAMPPNEGDRLTEQQLGWIRSWLAGGASWPSPERQRELAETHAAAWSAEDGIQVATSGGLSSEWTARRYAPESLWALQPVQRPTLTDSSDHAIDRLLALRCPPELQAAPATDVLTFVRRATFDLTGLPPSPAEVDEFVAACGGADGAALESTRGTAAISRLIERLLNSQHYGERMSQHWLDVVRYADSSGFANDYERGNAWRYRDYVVRAFNGDKPWNQFVIEQLAGDELDPGSSENLIAVGFLRMGPWELTGMEVEKIARQRFLDDVVNSVGESFLSQSLQCARCHDHKFDPIPTRDYYSMQAVFATTQISERTAAFLPVERTDGFEERRYLDQRQSEYLRMLAELDELLLRNAVQWYQQQGRNADQWLSAVAAARQESRVQSGQGSATRRKSSDVFSRARKLMGERGFPEDQYPPKLVGFTPQQFGLERVARKGLERLKWEFERYEPFALSVYSGATREFRTVNAPVRLPVDPLSPGEVEETCILTGGDPFAAGERVRPGVLSAVAGGAVVQLPETVSGRRLALARWIAGADNPLTARSIVNRIWGWHFGRSIAANPNNFGSTGGRPLHPELLDWLAAEFVDSGWSVKSLHRLIMSSRAYRRSSRPADAADVARLDPELRCLSCFPARRLTAEELRDALLSVSGELNLQVGGIPNRPELHAEVALQPRQVMGSFAAAWVPNPLPAQRHRRSLYALRLRGLPDPGLEVFNLPTPDFSCERRDSSTVTPQVFVQFNSQNSWSRSLAMASRVLRETATEDGAIQQCFRLAFGRSASATELRQCLKHWRDLEAVQREAVFRTPVPPPEVVRDAVEENTGERFQFTEKLYGMDHFVPDLRAEDCDARTRALADVCLVLLNSNEFIYVH
jgi:mono/diheme cytochrome c family protein